MITRRGFTLIELVVGLSIAAVMTAVLVGVGRGWLNTANQSQDVAAEARELSDVATATQAYLTQNGSTLPVGQGNLSVSQLVQAGLLPATFATRSPPPLFTPRAGWSPWYQSYQVVFAKLADGTTRAIVYEQGAANGVRLAHSGVPSTPAGLAALKTTLAVAVSGQYHLAAGLLNPGSGVIAGTMGGFTKDLGPLVSTLVTQPAVAVLIGFPDLGTEGSTAPPTAPPTRTSSLGCNVVHPNTTTHAAPTCPAATPNEVARWPYCAPFNSNFTKYAAYPSQVGTITVGKTITRSSNRFWATPGQFGPAYYEPRYDTTFGTQAFIIGGSFTDDACSYLHDGYTTQTQPTAGCITAPPGNDLTDMTAQRCTIGGDDPAIAALGTNGYNILCCAQ